MRSLLFVCVLLLAACAAPSPASLPDGGGIAFGPPAARITSAAGQDAYWTLFYSQPKPQIEIAGLPLKSSSKVKQIDGNGGNQLSCASAIRFVGSKVWVMNLAPCHASDPSIAQVYSLPLTSQSKPLYVFTLSGPVDGDHMTFDGSGNLWVSSEGNSTVYEYAGPFRKSGTLTPATTLTTGLNVPQGLGFDAKGNLYVANAGNATGSKAIAVFKAPISNRTPYYLKGAAGPAGLVFDGSGNLFVSVNAATGAIAEYASDNLKPGDKPSVIDSTGIAANAYGADLAFDAAGNLYDADCGDTAGIYSYPTATKKFTSKLAPSFYSNSGIETIGCVWGIAIH